MVKKETLDEEFNRAFSRVIDADERLVCEEAVRAFIVEMAMTHKVPDVRRLRFKSELNTRMIILGLVDKYDEMEKRKL